MKLKRKIIKEFEAWKNSKAKKALLVRGARQVGKTTTIRDFAAANYQNLVEINFEEKPSARTAFEGDLDARGLIINLSAMGYGPFEEGRTLIFLDEIQSCPAARTAIKFLVEDGRYDIVESGSLLGVNYADISSFPVGFEHEVEMSALDYEEFLWAAGVSEDVVATAHEAYRKVAPLPDFLHKALMDHYRKFLIIGGMPEVVCSFFENDDLSVPLGIQRDILQGYRADVSKYAGKDKLVAKAVFDSIGAQLSKEDKRFVLADLEKGASLRKYAHPTQWLVDAGMAYYSFNVGALALPFPLYENSRLYKLFMADTGLLCAMLMGRQTGFQGRILMGEVDINEGALTENFVACELRKHGVGLNYYDKKSKMELDFVYEDEGLVSIIEVKSGAAYKKHASLSAALRTFPSSVSRAMVMSTNNAERGNGVDYLPLYMATFVR